MTLTETSRKEQEQLRTAVYAWLQEHSTYETARTVDGIRQGVPEQESKLNLALHQLLNERRILRRLNIGQVAYYVPTTGDLIRESKKNNEPLATPEPDGVYLVPDTTASPNDPSLCRWCGKPRHRGTCAQNPNRVHLPSVSMLTEPDEPDAVVPLHAEKIKAAEVKEEDDDYLIDKVPEPEVPDTAGGVPCDIEGCKFKAKSALGLAIHKARAHGPMIQTKKRIEIAASRTPISERCLTIKRLREEGKSAKDIRKELRISRSTFNRCVHDLRLIEHVENKSRSEVIEQPPMEGEFICNECKPPKKFRSHLALRSHKACHSSEALRTCSKCGRVLGSPGAKGNHEKACKGTKSPDETTVPSEPAIPIRSAISTEPPGLIIEKVEGPTEYTPDPFAGLAKMLAELNAIPGVKVTVTISLGVSS